MLNIRTSSLQNHKSNCDQLYLKKNLSDMGTAQKTLRMGGLISRVAVPRFGQKLKVLAKILRKYSL